VGWPLADELESVAEAAQPYVRDGERLAAIIPAEPARGTRVYMCAFDSPHGRTWLGLDSAGRAIESRALVRDAVSIAALCELAEESAGGGDLDALRMRLDELAAGEGVEVAAARGALLELQGVLEAAPRVASPAYLDRIGAATRRLEQEFGGVGGSPFAEAMKQGVISVDGLTAEVEACYKIALS
jgi:hypothetical protein